MTTSLKILWSPLFVIAAVSRAVAIAPASEKPVSEKPVSEKPVSEKPVSEKPVSEKPVFEKDVLPIFTRYCFNCHGKSSPQLGLDLRSARRTLRGSQNGPVVVSGSREESLLWKKVSTREMPLKLFKLELSDVEIDTIGRWIEAGAPSSEPAELPVDVQEQFTRFETEIRPILTQHCTACHGSEDPKADLDLNSLESLLQGSQSGPVIVEGFSEKSVLIRKVSSGAMPPPDTFNALTPAQIQTLTHWIDRGRFADFIDVAPRQRQTLDKAEPPTVSSEDRQFWAFQKPAASPLPDVMAKQRVRTPIDRFVLANLEAAKLDFSPDASRSILLRRAFFDLIGLPPSLAQAQQFLADNRPDAFQRLLDRLVASPHYGERWGRHWLDAVGYVDTSDKDFSAATPSLSDGYWRYRDYVVAATNQDKPWDRFLIEQNAGDELVDWRSAKSYTPEILELLTATGYLRNVLDVTDEDISDLPFDRYEALFKLMERVSSSTLGLTLACARCHSHKFDPIPQTDYYRFLSLFTAAYNPSDWLPPKRRHLYEVSQHDQDKIEQQRTETTVTLNQLQEQITNLQQPYRVQLLDEKLEQVPEDIRADVKTAIGTAENERNDAQKEFVSKYQATLQVTDSQVDQALSDADQVESAQLRSKFQASQDHLATLTIDKIQALWDVGQAPTIRLLQRGDVDFAGPKVSPGFLTVLSAPGRSNAIPSPSAVGKTTGLRLAFAHWLTSPDHPLTARVIVNRFWQHHFGQGIVATPDNFGVNGSQPTHPALLDWLAVEFMRQGWSAKRFHKMMMTSTVYRQSSKRVRTDPASISDSARPAPQSTDPDNRLLWRTNLRRLDAEPLRDSVLAVSGQLNFSMGGPPVMLKTASSGLVTVDQQHPADSLKRSIYLLARRSYPLTFLRLFDYPVIDVNCTRRSTSATPLQSLTMINSQFVTTSASQLATRIDKLLGSNAAITDKIQTAYWLTLSRAPSPVELQASKDHLQTLAPLYLTSSDSAADAAQRTFENFVHILFCSNEFLYID